MCRLTTGVEHIQFILICMCCDVEFALNGAFKSAGVTYFKQEPAGISLVM